LVSQITKIEKPHNLIQHTYTTEICVASCILSMRMVVVCARNWCKWRDAWKNSDASIFLNV